MKKKLLSFAKTLLFLAIAGTFYAVPAMAQARATLTQDTDQAARAPFQVSVNITNNVVAVPIPAGKRLVIDFVAIHGYAPTAGPYIEPSIVFESTIAGASDTSYYLEPAPSTVDATQFHYSGPVTIYADTLIITRAYAGYAPTDFSFSVAISGHLITISTPATP
jgi:hypothetical protein